MAEARAQPAVEVEAGADAASATFTLHHEDHTMGNTLRYVLNKNPAVSFVGYSVPHPAEPKLQLRLQTVGPPAAALRASAAANCAARSLCEGAAAGACAA